MAASESFSTTTDTTAYALAATNIRKIYRVVRTDTTPDEPCDIIDALDQFDRQTNYLNGRWQLYLTRDPTTGLFSMNFPYYAVQGGMTFRVDYIRRVADIATGSGTDSSAYYDIDADYHELVVQRAACNLLGPDSSLYQAAVAKLGELEQKMQMDFAESTQPSEIQQDYF